MSDVCTKSLARRGSVSWLELFIFGSLGQVGLRPWEEGEEPRPSWGLGAVVDTSPRERAGRCVHLAGQRPFQFPGG